MFNPDQVSPIKPTIRHASTDGLGKTRPVEPPKSDKNFRRLIQDDDNDSDQSNMAVKNGADDNDDSTPSLFDLAKKPPKKNSEDSSSDNATMTTPDDAYAMPDEGQMVENKPQNPLETSTKMTSNQMIREEVAKDARLSQMKGNLNSLNDAETTSFDPKDKTKKTKSDSRSDFIQEHTDLAYVSQLNQRSADDLQAQIGDDIQQSTSHSATIKELINKMVEGIQTIKKGNETETVVTLKYPPILAGAHLNLSTTSTAKGEFNVSFTNLTPDGKNFLDQRLVGNALTAAMEDKGIVIHIVTTSTADKPVIQAEGEKFAQNQDREQQQQQEQQRRRNPFFEEEV